MQLTKHESTKKPYKITLEGYNDWEFVAQNIYDLRKENYPFAFDLWAFFEFYKPKNAKSKQMIIKLDSCYFACFCTCLEMKNISYIFPDENTKKATENLLYLLHKSDNQPIII